jgi:ribose transport system permease protein
MKTLWRKILRLDGDLGEFSRAELGRAAHRGLDYRRAVIGGGLAGLLWELAEPLAAGLDGLVKGLPAALRIPLAGLSYLLEHRVLALLAAVLALVFLLPRKVRDRLAPLFALLVLAAFLSLESPQFRTFDNLRNVARQYAPLSIIAMGQTFVIIAGGIDLSVGSVLALAGVVVGLLITESPHRPGPWADHLWLASLGGMGMGLLCGVLNGVVTTRAKMPPFIVTLGMMLICRGGALILTGGNPVFGIPEAFQRLAQDQFQGLPIPVWFMLGFALVAHFVLTYTRLGRYAYAIGGNAQAARLSGVPVDRYQVLFFGICGLSVGLAAVLHTSRLISAQPATGEMVELESIAAAVIGGASLFGGQGTIPGTLLGIFIMAILRNGCNLLGVSSYWQYVVVGVMIILAVFYDHLRRRAGSAGPTSGGS